MVSLDHGTHSFKGFVLISFSRLREECAQEEARLVKREENMGATDDQALVVYTRNNFNNNDKKGNFHHNKNKYKKPKNTKRDISNVQCYTCDEKGHLERDCAIKKRRHHAHVSKDDLEDRRMIQMKSMC